MSTHNQGSRPVIHKGQQNTPATPTPILNGLIMAGVIMAEPSHDQYTGCASDGTLCTMPGGIARPDQTERYLTDFPTPDMW